MKCDKCGVDPDDMVKLINECRDRLSKKEFMKFVNDMIKLNEKWMANKGTDMYNDV